ncbi:sensor histidine kinase [Cryptosporangium aurantiacum]|uniref:sensor histidine kinase n=1 Tax=Cryptosporangium aurantiacum TaxID=134849 RepID=UPI0011612F3C|nr:sensor histidine kinase [Cryptosporangium aurantiacum]
MTSAATPAPPLSGSHGHRPRIARFGWLFGGVWLFFLIEPAQTALAHESLALRVYGVVTLLAFSAWYLLIFTFVRSTSFRLWEDEVRRGWIAIGVLLALAALTVPACRGESLATLVYIAAAAMMVLPARHAFTLTGVFVVVVLVLDAFPETESGASLVFSMIVAALAVWGIRQMIARNIELLAAQQTIAQLAVAEERARTARDLHDILGHSLTVITVKAELAGRLITVDPERAGREVADLERLSREALADVRRTVSGYRPVTLAGELAGARAALDAADIDAELPTALDEVPGERRELFGWVVREGVTNVVRHAAARRCVVTVTRDRVEVADDGRGPTDEGMGNGLTGLRERVEAAGGALTVGRSPLGGFLLRVTLTGVK